MAAVYKLTVIESTGTTFKHEPKDSSQLTNPDDKMAIPKGTSYLVTLDTDDDPKHEHYHVVLPTGFSIKNKRNWYVYKKHVSLEQAKWPSSPWPKRASWLGKRIILAPWVEFMCKVPSSVTTEAIAKLNTLLSWIKSDRLLSKLHTKSALLQTLSYGRSPLWLDLPCCCTESGDTYKKSQKKINSHYPFDRGL